MLFGYVGRLLNVDLSSRKFHSQNLDPQELKQFVGGAGYNAWLLYQAVAQAARIHPLSPENPLIFGAGPLVGTSFPTAARSTFTALSPLTSIFGDSNGGGLSGVAVKKSGFDHIVIKGSSETPCNLILGPNGKCRIEDATDIWGLTTHETEKRIKQRYPKAVVFSIGPAGENLVKYAAITSGNNTTIFGRSGMGAVMGSKRLKAIVALGGTRIEVKNRSRLKQFNTKVLQNVKNCSRPRLFQRYGTAMFLNIIVAKGLMYAENWRRKISSTEVKEIDIGAYYDAAQSRSHGCFRCPLACGKKWQIKYGRYQGEKGHGFEVAHILSFGLTLGIRDMGTILHLINRCNQLGLDLNEFCGTAGMATDAYQHGFLSPKAADGLSLDWGKGDIIDTLIDKVAKREGIGDILAEGTRNAARIIGPEAQKYALHMKGMHWPAHSAPPFALAFSLSTRGGDFLKGVPHLLLQKNIHHITSKLFGATTNTNDIYTHEEKGRAVWWHENYKLMIDSLGSCFYLSLLLLPHGSLFASELSNAYEAATGISSDGLSILHAAEKSYQVERAINALRGMEKKDDAFTRRPESDSWGSGIDMGAKGMLDEYYAYRGLSLDGRLTRQRLEEVHLGTIAERLLNANLLGHSKDYLSLATIIKDPKASDIENGIKSKIISRIERHMMDKLGRDPLYFRKFFEKQERKEKP